MAFGQVTNPSLTLSNIAVMRGGHLVLRQFSCEARSGDIIWLRGSNGSGKSTLLRTIAGLLPVAAGTIDREGTIALTDEHLSLDADLTLEKALGFWQHMDGTDTALFDRALSAFDLHMLTDVPLRYLSSGQRKRAALARMIISGADIWLLDEPYNALDSGNATRLDSALLKHVARGGIAIVAAHQSPGIAVAQSIVLEDRFTKKAAA